MTTICCLKAKDFCLIGSDTRVSQSNLKLPLRYSKIHLLTDEILVASAGSVSESQILPRQCMRSLRQSRVLLDLESDNILLNDFAREFSEYLFSLKLKLRHYSVTSFIVGGINEHLEPTVLSLDGDGSLLKIPSYWSIGSGAELALSVLNNGYNDALIFEDGIKLMLQSLMAATALDLFTNDSFELFVITKDGINPVNLNFVKEPPANE